MKPIVIYSTHRSNTEKIALAIAQAADCQAVKLTANFDVSSLPLADYDTIFLGTGVRGGEPYTEMVTFLKTADWDIGKRFLLFMTWAGGGASDKLTYQIVKKLLEAKGQELEQDYFLCLGQTFGFTRRGHPNQADLADAEKWVTEKLK